MMDLIPMGPALVETLGWTLVHSAWQITAIAVVLAAAVHVGRPSPAVRYAWSCGALALMLAAPLLTFATRWNSLPPTAAAKAPAVRAAAAVVAVELTNSGASPALAAPGSSSTYAPAAVDARTADPGAASWMRTRLEPALPTLVALWLTGLALGFVRLGGGWWRAQRLRFVGTEPLPREWLVSLDSLARRVGLARRIDARQSSRVASPSVVGWLRPLVLIPAAALTGLPRAQLEAVLLHELAHIRRHDYLVNLAQALAETLLFYHPAVWFVSSRIRAEREHCCDDLAVDACGDAVTYATALAELERLRAGMPGSFVMAATRGPLFGRIERILDAGSAHEPRAANVLALVLTCALGGTVGALAWTPVATPESIDEAEVQAPPVPPVPPAPAAAPAAPPAIPAIPAIGPRSARVPALPLPPPPPAAAHPASPAEPAVPPAPPEPPPDHGGVHAPLPGVPGVPGVPPAARAPFAPAVPPPAIPAPARAPAAGPRDAPPPPPPPPAFARPPAVPAQPAPPPPPPPAADSEGGQVSRSARTRQFSLDSSHDDRRLIVKGTGDLDVTDDDTDVRTMSEDGHLTIEERAGGASHRVELRRRGSGPIERRYLRDGRELPFEPEGRAWLARALPDILRRTGIAAPARVARILAKSGPSGVLAEVSKVPSDFVKRVYLSRLVETATLDGPTVQALLAQAGQELNSDFELTTLLLTVAKRALPTDAARLAYVQATGTIGSSFESRRALEGLVDSGRLSEPVVTALLKRTPAIDSDFEAASLLTRVAASQDLGAASAQALVAATGSIGSDFEKRRALAPLFARPQLPAPVLDALLVSARDIDSDFELATLLLEFVGKHGAAAAAQPNFFPTVDGLQSAFERGRLLQSVARQANLSSELARGVIASVGGITSDFEAASVLVALADSQRLDEAARQAYTAAAGRLGSSHERERALSKVRTIAAR